jgi:hypothetical protein
MAIDSTHKRPRRQMKSNPSTALVDRFEAVARQFTGRLAAPESALPAPREAIDHAIRRQGERRDLDETQAKRLDYLLVDLQAFVADADADLVARVGDVPQELIAVSDEQEASHDVLIRIRKRQAALLHELRRDPSAVGDAMALTARWYAIGEGQGVLEAVAEYREQQAESILSLSCMSFRCSSAYPCPRFSDRTGAP